MNTLSHLALATLLLVPGPLYAQHQRPYDYKLTEPDQELDNFGGRFAGIHKISVRLRGVRGTGSTLYWVSTDGRQLTAYRRGQQLWQTNITQAFTKVLPNATIDKIIFSSDVVFVLAAKGGHAEVNRTTGKVSAVGVDIK